MFSDEETTTLKDDFARWGKELGFQAVGVSHLDLAEDAAHLRRWLQQGHHGQMQYMAKHGRKRYVPDDLVPQTVSVISARMDYFPPNSTDAESVLNDRRKAYVARYALGRDYHKVFRLRLKKFAQKIEARIGDIGYRVFVDSAPVLERALARNAGLGWIGKNTNLINKSAGSWFFLGEIYTDLALRTDKPSTNHCGSCSACLQVCPTNAFVGPYELDARRCISYLTIELKGSIPKEYRKPIGNRIYGCDDCQLVCPWNKFAKRTTLPDFEPRQNLDNATLLELFLWSERDFEKRTEGSPIRRIGFVSWLRNIAVALGNSDTDPETKKTLSNMCSHNSNIVSEHASWALDQHLRRGKNV
ncbi:MAG: tRNA epoxyqueuosine(34) reductase QueG [Pseudomonadota bacterium]